MESPVDFSGIFFFFNFICGVTVLEKVDILIHAFHGRESCSYVIS